MWWVYLGTEVLHKSGDREYQVYSPTLELALSKAGSLEFSVPTTHRAYQRLHDALGTSEAVRVERGSEEVWRGRVYSESASMSEGMVTFVCEGDLAMLNDVVMPLYSFNGTPSAYLRKLLDAYNAACDSGNEIHAGTVDVSSGTEEGRITRWNETPKIVWEELSEKTAGSEVGGYLMLRRSGSTRYLDWLELPNTGQGQPIKTAINLLELSGVASAADIVTAIYPYGDPEADEGNGHSYHALTLSGDAAIGGGCRQVNGYVVNTELYNRYGLRATHRQYSATTAANLRDSAAKDARLLSFATTYEVDAVDMSLAGSDVPPFELGQRLSLAAGAVEGTMLITGLELHLDDPTGDKVTLGPVKVSAASQNAGNGILINDAKAQAQTAAGQSQTAIHAAASKKRTFIEAPEPPYDVGDMWVMADGKDILVCTTARGEGEAFSLLDWERASDYTNDDVANEALGSAQEAWNAAMEAISSGNVVHCKCSTAGDEGFKTLEVIGSVGQDVELVEGLTISVAFDHANTSSTLIFMRIGEDGEPCRAAVGSWALSGHVWSDLENCIFVFDISSHGTRNWQLVSPTYGGNVIVGMDGGASIRVRSTGSSVSALDSGGLSAMDAGSLSPMSASEKAIDIDADSFSVSSGSFEWNGKPVAYAEDSATEVYAGQLESANQPVRLWVDGPLGLHGLIATPSSLFLYDGGSSSALWSINPAAVNSLALARGTGTTALPAGTMTLIPMSTTGYIECNDAGNYSVSNSGIRVAAAGYYRLTGGLCLTAFSSGTSPEASVYIRTSTNTWNSGYTQRIGWRGWSVNPQCGPVVCYLAAGTKVFLVGRALGMDNVNDNGNVETFLLVERVS